MLSRYSELSKWLQRIAYDASAGSLVYYLCHFNQRIHCSYFVAARRGPLFDVYLRQHSPAHVDAFTVDPPPSRTVGVQTALPYS